MGLREMCTPPVMKRIEDVNQRNLKAVPSGSSIEYEFLGGILFIGKHTSAEAKAILTEIRKSPDMYYKGKIEVQRTAGISAGDVKVIPPPRSEQAQFKGAIARISKKKVIF